MPFDPFRPLEPGERSAQLAAFLSFAESRDGEPDREHQRLPRRDAFLAALDAAPVRSRGAFGRAAFAAPLHRRRVRDLDPRTAWVLAAAKANEGEHYGIELELERFARTRYEGVDPGLLHVALEDRDHTRMLARACLVFGVELELAPPALPTRALVRTMNHLPDGLRFALIHCGEVTGAVLFRVLYDATRLFRAEPDVEERLRLLAGEILLDELGHVAYCRTRVPAHLLRIARALVPAVALALLREIPEFALLAGGRAAVLRRLRAAFDVPPALAWLDESGPARSLPGSRASVCQPIQASRGRARPCPSPTSPQTATRADTRGTSPSSSSTAASTSW